MFHCYTERTPVFLKEKVTRTTSGQKYTELFELQNKQSKNCCDALKYSAHPCQACRDSNGASDGSAGLSYSNGGGARSVGLNYSNGICGLSSLDIVIDQNSCATQNPTGTTSTSKAFQALKGQGHQELASFLENEPGSDSLISDLEAPHENVILDGVAGSCNDSPDIVPEFGIPNSDFNYLE